MITGDLYLGEPMTYWVELKRQADKNNTRDLIFEIASLRAKVSFYEDRVSQMNHFKQQVGEKS